MPSGVDWIVGGLTAAVLLPVLALGVGMPFWIAGLVSLLAGGGVFAVLTPSRPFARLDASGAARGKIEFARELLSEAEPQAARLAAAARAIKTAKVADQARHLETLARAMLAAVEKDPMRVDAARRLLTYYLPRAAEIAEAYVSLEASPVRDEARIAATGDLINRLDAAFIRFAANLQGADVSKLDIEMKLLKASLDDDLGPVDAPVAARLEAAGKN